MQTWAVPFTRHPPVLGMGALFKSSLCLIKDGTVFLSEPFGALDNPETMEAYDKQARAFLEKAGPPPVRVACDLHPDFFSTRYAESLDQPLFPVQHHHAHIAATLAEHGVTEPVIGLALDGFGLGPGNQSWGGELLRVDARGFQRLGRLRPLPQPGGDAAARAPWRMAAGALWSMGRGGDIASRFAAFAPAQNIAQLIERRVNCPQTSSAGRLFDAACGLLGVKPEVAFEGEAPMALEDRVRTPRVMPEGWQIAERDGLIELDLLPLLARLADMHPDEGADVFHGTLIAALTAWIARAAKNTGLGRVAFGGGCFMNKVLREGLAQQVESMEILPLWTQKISPGDASVSLGQAYAALWNFEAEGN